MRSLWENLEYSRRNRRCRRRTTALVTLLLLAVSFLIVYFAQREKKAFAERTASVELCEEVPAAFYGSYGAAVEAARGVGGADLVSPPPQRNRTQDAQCGSGRIALYYPGAPVPSSPAAVHYPNATAACLGPCVPVDTASTDVECGTLACHDEGARQEGFECLEYRLGARLQCYCRSVLTSYVAQYGLLEGGERLLESERDACESFATNFVLAQTLSIVASMVIVAVNTLLKGVLQGLAAFEVRTRVWWGLGGKGGCCQVVHMPALTRRVCSDTTACRRRSERSR